MSADFSPPAIEVSSPEPEEQESFKSGARTPRPYHHDADEIRQDRSTTVEDSRDQDGDISLADHPQWKERTRQVSVTGSESGTEADDERQSFVRALPAPHPRLRKGLKTGETNVDVLLTPSQLDDEGRRLSQDYFRRPSREKTVSEDDQKAEREKLLKIRLAEFARRSSEVALMAVIVLCVFCGKGVLRTAYQWRRELLAHVAIITGLILAYPVKLSIVDSSSQARKIWQRFRVPASFDPATVLYPTLLPVLVALSVSPANPATILPNVILGLSSLPQRLFPRSSRLSGINVLHWFVSIIPLIAAENTAWPSKLRPATSYALKNDSLGAETLASLYPLHHALLQPLQYLTTTSLLISELHLLSAALINVLLLADSPQIVILKACLWIGGVCLFVPCASLLRWNVTLMRVPKWKFRQPGHPADGRLSLVDAVSSLLNVQRATVAFRRKKADDSDADEDEPVMSIKQKSHKRRLSLSTLTRPSFDKIQWEPKSAIEPSTTANGILPELSPRPRSRGNTMPVQNRPTVIPKVSSSQRKESSPNLLWYLHLTAAQAERRKWIYAACIYTTIAATILVPVRYYVLEKALGHLEPIGWALGYLLGQIGPLRSIVYSLNLDGWIAIPLEPIRWQDITASIPLDVPSLRFAIGAANMRLVLIAFWGLVLVAGLLAVFSLTAFVEVDTRRKVFHGVMVAMMLPSTFIDPCACALALTLILAVFLLLEVIRAGQVPPLGNAIGRFVAPYVDGRDLRGPVVVSHFFLLIGCAIPLWFSLASMPRAGYQPWAGWELVDERREVAMVAGVICVGMGDAAASLFGRRYGRHKWMWVGGKSLEGSAAFAAAVTVGLVATKAWMVLGGWNDNCGSLTSHTGQLGALPCILAWTATFAKAVFCACAASFMEAVLTGANDNVVVPVALWLLVKGVRL